ncbi:MAG TPA: BTAD domain-containing putative transcriptional regulator [Candidatus Dormibacteraeota bacterium]
MLVCVLGPLEIRDGATLIPPGGRRQRSILAGLALDAGKTVSWFALETAAWGEEPPATSRHTIATHVLRLRAAGLAIRTTPEGYCLDTPTDAVGLERNLEHARALLDHDPVRSAELLRDALELWRGRPFPELDHVPEAEIEAARLEELVEGVREQLLRTELVVGRADDLVATARSLVAEQPYREHRWELLMLALYRSGRQAEALDVYAQARARLIDELGVEPGPALQRMQQAVLAQDPALDAPAGGDADRSSRSRLPGTATRLIGRAVELQDLTEVWDRARLATLLGPPGAGKTRLALEAGAAAAGQVWYVDVEHLPSTEPVAAAVLDVIAPSSRSIDAADGMIERLRDASGLVILDGCERRLREVADQVRRLLASCAQIRVLVTSRERLGVLDEALIPVGPLAPDDALVLLADRARLVNARFSVAPTDQTTAGRLCDLVDRLPLALELVARHLNLISVRELTTRVETDLGRWAGRSAGGRDGLWLALDTSVATLSTHERQVLLAFAVMVTDADTDLVADVVGPGFDADLHEVIGRLVDASLLQVRSAMSTTRCQLLRTVAVHTLEAADGGDVTATRLRYIDAVLERVASVVPRLATPDRPDALRELDSDMPHVRAVFGELCAPGADRRTAIRGLDIATLLTDYWLGRRPAEGLEWLTRLVAAAEPPAALRAEALLRCGHLAYWITDFARGDEMAASARALFRELGDALGEGRALRRLGAIAAATDDLAAARSLLEESQRRLEDAGVEAEIGITLLHLGSLLADEGDVDAALPALQRALTIAADSDNPLARGQALAALLLAEWKGGDLEAALRSGEVALQLFRELGHSTMEGTVAYRLAAVTRGLGRSDVARTHALLAIDAGETAGTRTTVALGHLNLARLDLNDDASGEARAHLGAALAIIDPSADRWVLVEALEVAARLLSVAEPAEAAALLHAATVIRSEIRQPVPPTDAAELERTRARIDALGLSAPGPSASAAGIHARATAAINEGVRSRIV